MLSFKNFILFSIISLFIGTLSIAQDCDEFAQNLSWDFQVNGSPLETGDEFFIECNVTNFTNVLAFQYTLNFDPSVIKFKEIDNVGSPLIGPVEINSTPTVLENGQIAMIWTNGNGEAQSVTDGSIYKLFFEVVGNPNDCSVWNLNSSLIPVEISWELPDGDICSENNTINYELSGGELCINCGLDLYLDASACNNEINFSICGGIAPYSYTIEGSNSDTSGTSDENEMISISQLESDSYLFTIQDANGLSFTDTIDNILITEPTLTGSDICEGEVSVITVTEEYSNYIWYLDGQLIPSLQGLRIIEVIEPGVYSVVVFEGSCSSSTEIFIDLIETPEVVVEDIQVCNSSSSGNPTIVDLTELILSTTGDYTIEGPNGEIITTPILDFEGQVPGDYVYQVIVDFNPNCPVGNYELIITVIECDCPEIILANFGDFCNDINANLELFNFLGPGTSADGVFSITDLNGNITDLQDNGTTLLIDENLEAGIYTVTYTLDESLPDCPFMTSNQFEIFAIPQPIFITPQPICNSDTLDNITTINLDDLVSNAEGFWQDENGTNIDPMLDFNGFSPDIISYFFTTTGAEGQCNNFSTPVNIEVIDCQSTYTIEIYDEDILVFPNPSSDFISINGDTVFEKIEIFNIQGSSVLKTAFKNQLNISQIEAGIYFMKLTPIKGSSSKMIKFIKSD